MINKIKNNKFGNWIFKKKESVHYGEVLENILQILLTFQVRIKNSNYVGKEKDLQNIMINRVLTIYPKSVFEDEKTLILFNFLS